MQDTHNHHGIVLFAHGSRDPLWRAPIEAVRQHLEAQHPPAQQPTSVRCAYLELCTPSLPLRPAKAPVLWYKACAVCAPIRWVCAIPGRLPLWQRTHARFNGGI